jgi:hypothetical protein
VLVAKLWLLTCAIDLSAYRYASTLIDITLNVQDFKGELQLPDDLPDFMYQFFYNLTQLTGNEEMDEQVTKDLFNYLLLCLGCDRTNGLYYSWYKVYQNIHKPTNLLNLKT